MRHKIALFNLKYRTTELGNPSALVNLAAAVVLYIASGTPVSVAASNAEINLYEGSDITLSARENKIAFNLAGRIWIMSPDNPLATPLTGKTEYSQHPAFSPDASLIAYESIVDGFHQIIVMRADGSEPRQVTFGSYHHRTPVWSPASEARLVMSSNRGGDYGLWLLDLESLALNQLTFLSGDETEPAWNDDGSKIAFVRDVKNRSGLYLYEPGSDASVILVEDDPIRAPSWRPGGGVLTYVRQSDDDSQLRMLILSDPIITKPITVTETVHPTPARWIDRANFFYAADGRIKRREFGMFEPSQVPFEARVQVADEPYARREVDFGDNGNRPVRGISGAVKTSQGTLIVSALGDLWEFVGADDDRRLLRQLTNDVFVDTHPAVSPDGSTLAFVSDRDGSLQIWLMDLTSMQRRRLTSETGMAIHPSWNQESSSIAYLVANHPAAAYLNAKRITIASGDVETLAENISNALPPVRDETSGPVSYPENEEQTKIPTTSTLPVVKSIPLTWREFAPAGRLTIQAGHIFDGIGPGYLSGHEIVIQGNRIEEVRPWIDSPSASEVIDAREYTVMPGFIDLAAQQSFASGEHLGRAWLAYGVTTIRESVSDIAEAVERQESWRSGRRIGPRMLMALKLCNQDFKDTATNNLAEIIGLADVALIELCASVKGELLGHAISTAHGDKLPVATSTPFPDILLGVDEIQVGIGPADPSMAMNDIATVVGLSGKTMVSRLATAGLPGLSTRSSLTGQERYRRLFSAADRDWYANLWSRQLSSSNSAGNLNARAAGQSLFRAIAAGARVAAGSNAPLTPFGLGLHAELRLLADIGLQPFQILKMASLDAARLIGAGEQLGSIQKGKLADLVVIDGDPLADISQAENIVITIVNGRAYEQTELISRGSRPTSVGKFYNYPPP
jgi:Tol biopolymer transport system component